MIPKAQVRRATTLIERNAVAEFMAAHEKMVDETMEVRLTDWVDHDFAALMVPLCRGAIDMARIQLVHGTDADTRRFADQIIAQQLASIETLLKWLDANAGQRDARTSPPRTPSDRALLYPSQPLAEPKGGSEQ